MVSKFKCSEKEAVIEYQRFSRFYSLHLYKELYNIMHNIWLVLNFNEKDFENDIYFKYKNLYCFVDKENGSYCEVIGSGWFSIPDRIIIHKKVLDKIIQYKNK